MTGRVTAAALAATLLLAGCENANILGDNAVNAGYIADQQSVVEKANWDEVEEIKVTLHADHSIDPAYISLENGKPYKLSIRNFNWTTQSFAAKDFYKTIAVREVTSSDDSFEFARLDEIIIPSGETREISFVPTKRGVYEVTGRFVFYTSLGFVGRIEVE